MDFKRIKHDKVFEGKVFDVWFDRIEYENGIRAEREAIDKHKEAAAVIGVDDEGCLILVEQYRYGTGFTMLEIPAGVMESEEEPLACAKREFEEETGLKPGSVTELFAYYVTPAYCNEKIYFFFAKDLTESSQHLDEDEFVEVHRFTPEEALTMIEQGKITDGKTVAAIYAAKAKGLI